MRTLFGWMVKLSVIAVIWAGVTGQFGKIEVPDTVLGYKVPDSVKRQVESAGKIKEYGADTTAGFKKIGDAFSR
jgi:hypothetical protein